MKRAQLAGLLVLVIIAGCSRSQPSASSAKEVYPWAECGVCVDFIKTYSGEPGSVTITEWKSREATVLNDGKNYVKLGVSFRGKNDAGAVSAWDYRFEVLDGVVYHVDDLGSGRSWHAGNWHPAPK